MRYSVSLADYLKECNPFEKIDCPLAANAGLLANER